jgi:hypothetical protein
MSEGFDNSYTAYQADRSRLRKLVRRAYLRSARDKLRGPTLDFGCGVGELLATLPDGSMGIEYNRATVEHCVSNGLDVAWYDGYADDWALMAVDSTRRFESMVVSHVLEHLDAPMEVLGKLLASAARLGIQRALVIVPGSAGFRIDQTHRTFVDHGMLEKAAAPGLAGFRVQSSRYFPLNARVVGDWFPHHELQVLLVRE